MSLTACVCQVACETATKTNMVMIFGEITTSAKVDYEKVVRDTCREVGFTSDDVGLDADKCKVRLQNLLYLIVNHICTSSWRDFAPQSLILHPVYYTSSAPSLFICFLPALILILQLLIFSGACPH